MILHRTNIRQFQNCHTFYRTTSQYIPTNYYPIIVNLPINLMLPCMLCYHWPIQQASAGQSLGPLCGWGVGVLPTEDSQLPCLGHTAIEDWERITTFFPQHLFFSRALHRHPHPQLLCLKYWDHFDLAFVTAVRRQLKQNKQKNWNPSNLSVLIYLLSIWVIGYHLLN